MDKRCFKCGETKPLDSFYRHPGMKDGHLNKCKECNKVDSSMRDPEKVRAYEKERCKRPERKAYFIESQRRRRTRNPEKRIAYQKVVRAIANGLMSRQPCSTCGATERIEAHHEDYTKPLAVIWFCKKCHERHHAANEPLAVPF